MLEHHPHLPDGLRYATRADAGRLAELINIAGEGLPAWMWSSAGNGNALDVGEQRAARDAGDFSWTNCVVAERDGEVVAMLLAFPIEEQDVTLAELPAVIRPLVKLEMESTGTFYINGLATLPEFRGHGLGKQLLDVASLLAQVHDCDELSVQVFASNSGARKLYEREGFREVAREPMPVVDGLPPFEASVLLLRHARAD